MSLAQVAAYVQLGLLDDRGNYDASSDVYPTTGGSGAAGAILKGDIYTVNTVGTIDGLFIPIGSTIRALADAPAQVSASWAIMIYENVGKVYINDSNGEPQFYDTLTLAEAGASSGDSIYMNTDFTENLSLSKDLNIIGNGHTITGRISITATINCKIYGVTVIHNHLTEKSLSISNSSTIDALGSTFKNNLGETINVASGSTLNYGKSEEGTFKNLGEANCHDSYVPTANLVAIHNDGGTLNFCKGKSVNNIGLYSEDGVINTCIGESDNADGIRIEEGFMSLSKGISNRTFGGSGGINGQSSVECIIDSCSGYGSDISGGLGGSTTTKIRNCYGYSKRSVGLSGYDVEGSTGESNEWNGMVLNTGAKYNNCTAITHSALKSAISWQNPGPANIGYFTNGFVIAKNYPYAFDTTLGVVGDTFVFHGTTFETNNAAGSLGIRVNAVGFHIQASNMIIKAQGTYTPSIINDYLGLPDNQGNRLI
jgi:hypothetical protein